MACFKSSPAVLSVQKATSNFSRVSWIQTKFDPTSFSVKTSHKFRLTIYTNKRVRNGMDRDKLLLALWIVWFFWNPSAYQQFNITMEQAEKRACHLVLLHASTDQACSPATRVFLAFHREKAFLIVPTVAKRRRARFCLNGGRAQITAHGS